MRFETIEIRRSWSDLRAVFAILMHGVAPHMCDQVVCPLLDQEAGGRSPGFLLLAMALGDPAPWQPSSTSHNHHSRRTGHSHGILRNPHSNRTPGTHPPPRT